MKTKTLDKALTYFAVGTMIAVSMLALCGVVRAEGLEGYSLDEWADAIYLAEGGEAAVKPYGILSVPCEGKEDCRQVCKNTVFNTLVRYRKQRCGDVEGVACLAERYAPRASHRLNKHWKGNVVALLARGA